VITPTDADRDPDGVFALLSYCVLHEKVTEPQNLIRSRLAACDRSSAALTDQDVRVWRIRLIDPANATSRKHVDAGVQAGAGST